jgi:hypothetical protein
MAGRASLAFLGQEDVVLSGLPEVTYFSERYSGETQFAYRVDEVQFQSDATLFGGETYAILPKSGDVITNLYLKVPMPVQAGTRVFSSAGTLMIKYIELYIGSQLVERLWGEFIEMKMDLEIPQTKQNALAILTGKGTTLSLATYTLPIPFSCFKKGLPICAIEDDVTIRVLFYPSTIFSTITTTTQIYPILNVEYTYLSQAEVDYIKMAPQVFIFEQVQREEFLVTVGTNAVTCPLQFSNPVKEIFLVIQNSSAQGYDYSNVPGGGTDQLLNASLVFGTTERIPANVGTPIFLRNIQALEFHTRIPDGLFYMYSFSLDPEGEEPTGHVNLSRISNQNLILNMSPSTDNRNIVVYAVNYNFLTVDKGHAPVMFNNFES